MKRSSFLKAATQAPHQRVAKQQKKRRKKGGIHIKASHEGLLHKTAHKPAGEKFTTAELQSLKNSPNPATRKRATFALNAKGWSHK